MKNKAFSFLKPFLPAAVTGALMFSCATAPVLLPIPELLPEPERKEQPAVELLDSTRPERTAQQTGNAQALVQEAFSAPENGYADGVYTGSAMGFGGLITVQVTIENGQITGVSVVSAPNETSEYLSRALSVTGSIVAAQSPNVDTVSGATYSSSGIINAVKAALRKAKPSADDTAPDGMPADQTPERQTPGRRTAEGKTREEGQSQKSPSQTSDKAAADHDELPTGGYVDGVFVGTGEGFGGDITVRVTITNGQIMSIDVLSAEDETEPFFTRAKAVLPKILEQQTPDVDSVSGATFSSEGLKEAVRSVLIAKTAPEASPAPNIPGQNVPDVVPFNPERTSIQPDEPQPTSVPSVPEEPDEPVPTSEPSAPEEPDEPEPSAEPSTPEEPVATETVSETIETYTGSAMVFPDEYEDFTAYQISLTLTVQCRTVTRTEADKETVTTERTIQDVTVTGSTSKSNLRFLTRAAEGMHCGLVSGNAEVDGVSGATCSSEGIRTAYRAALSQIQLGTTQLTRALPPEPVTGEEGQDDT